MSAAPWTLGLCLGLAAPAMAQDSAASEALFNKGVADMEAGKYASACPALAESHRLDPRAGTMFALAECEAKWGKLASAVAHYSDYVGLVSLMTPADKTRHADRAKTAEKQMSALRPQVPQLTLVLPANAPPGTVVKRDGLELSGVSLGTALPVDPGDHVIVTQVPSAPEHEQKVTLAAGESKRLELQLELPKDEAATPPAASESPPVANEPLRDAPAPSGSHTWAYVAGGIGVAGLVVGTVTGLMSMGKKKTVDDNCVGTVCNDEGLSASDDGKTLGNISTVGFGVGIVGVATGVVLWLAAPRATPKEAARRSWQPSALVSGSAATVGLTGTW